MSEDKFHAVLSENWDNFELDDAVDMLMDAGYLRCMYFGPRPNTPEARKRAVYIVDKPFTYRDKEFMIGNIF